MTEVEGHNKEQYWEVIRRSEVTTLIIKSIWSFKRKRNPSGQIIKHKARIYAYRGMQRWGEGYYKTYTPVVNWLSIRFLLTILMALDLDTRSIDFTIAYPQVDLKTAVFMNIPFSFKVEGEANTDQFCLKLLTNWYRLRDRELNWFDCIKIGLLDHEFKQSDIDPYLFTKGKIIIVVYIDDVIIASKGSRHIENLLHSLKYKTDVNSGVRKLELKKFDFTDDRDIKTFLGVNIDKTDPTSMHISQPHLIARTLDTVGL